MPEQCVKICTNLLLSSKNTRIWNELNFPRRKNIFASKCISRHTKRPQKAEKENIEESFHRWKRFSWMREKAAYLAPIESIVQMNGLSSSPNPAITGWQKYGPNLKKNYKFLLHHHLDLLMRSLRISTTSKEWKVELAWKTLSSLNNLNTKFIKHICNQSDARSPTSITWIVFE